MFKLSTQQLIARLYRKRPNLNPEEMHSAKERIWQQIALELDSTTMKPTYRKFSPFILTSLVGVIIVLVTSAVFYLPRKHTEQSSSSNLSSSTLLFLNQESYASRTVSSGGSISSSFGYVKKSQARSDSNTVYAAEVPTLSDYIPTIFMRTYEKVSAIEPFYQLSQYDLTSGTKTDLTHQDKDVDSIAFSSLSQVLAYSVLNPAANSTHHISDGTCTLYIRDISAQKILNHYANPGECYQPITWSPDGRTLAVQHIQYDPLKKDAAPTISLGFYSLDSQTFTPIASPKPGYGPNNREALWLNSDLLLVNYYNPSGFTLQGANIDAGYYVVNRNTHATDSFPLHNPLPIGLRLVNNELYYIAPGSEGGNLTSFVLVAENIDSHSIRTIKGVMGAKEFLVSFGEDKVPTSYVLNGFLPPAQSAIWQVNTQGGTIDSINTDQYGLEISLIGWDKDYTHFLFSSTNSVDGQDSTHIYEYDFSTKKATLLVK